MSRSFLGNAFLFLMGATLSLASCQPGRPSVAPTVVNLPTETQSPTKSTPSAGSNYQMIWTYQTEGAVWGTPSINDGIVYFGSDDHDLYALDAQSGELKWQFSTNGLVRSRPAVVDGKAYFVSDDGYLYAVEATSGQQVWRTDIGNYSESQKRENPGTIPDPTTFDYLQSSPVVVNQMIYAGSADGKVYALVADTGKVIWTFATGQKVRANPTVDGDVVYLGSWDGKVYALDGKSGEARWATPIGGQIQTTALVADGLVYSASRKASVVALDAQTGVKVWEFEYGKNQWVESSPTLVGDLIYIGSSGCQYLLGLDRKSGKVRVSYIGNVFMWSQPWVIDHRVYIGATSARGLDSSGELLALDIPEIYAGNPVQHINLKWAFPVGTTLMPDGVWNGVASSPVMAEGVVYFGGLDGKMYALIPES